MRIALGLSCIDSSGVLEYARQVQPGLVRREPSLLLLTALYPHGRDWTRLSAETFPPGGAAAARPTAGAGQPRRRAGGDRAHHTRHASPELTHWTATPDVVDHDPPTSISTGDGCAARDVHGFRDVEISVADPQREALRCALVWPALLTSKQGIYIRQLDLGRYLPENRQKATKIASQIDSVM